MARYGEPFWWCPYWHDPGANMQPTDGIPNTSGDMVGILIDTNTPSTFVDQVPDQEDHFMVERIVGQYLVHGDEDPPAERLMHHRIYVANSNENSVSIRDLFSIDEAKSSFLWHKVEAWSSSFDGKVWGNWWHAVSGSGPTGLANASMARMGHFDIGVKRRIDAGNALIWHTQLGQSGGGLPVDDTFGLMLWIRLLVRMST